MTDRSSSSVALTVVDGKCANCFVLLAILVDGEMSMLDI